MRHTPRVLVSGAVTGLLALGLVGAPAQADTKKEKRAEKRQNSNITKNRRSITSLRNSTKQTTDALGRLAGIAASENRTNAATIAAVVPAVTTALTQLRDGLTAAGAGLTTLGSSVRSLAAAQEFGVVQLYVGNAPATGQILTSSDIPDDSNPAVLTGRFLVPVPNGTPATELSLRAAIRSGESDGVAGGNAAGVAGLQSMTVNNATTNVTIAGGNPGTPPNGQVPLTSAPNAAQGGAPVYPIALKAPRVDATPNPFAFPADQSIDLTDPATLQTLTAAPGKYTVANASGAGGVATVDFTVRFHDLSASATDLNE